MKWVNERLSEVLQKLEVDQKIGLNQLEVGKRHVLYGLNEFVEEEKETLLRKVFHHLTDIATIILIVAASIAAYMAIFQGGTWPKVIVILTLVVVNVVLGIYQENRAEKALEALKKMNAFKTTVIRDGTKQIIESSQLVPGDIIELTAGDVITADARLISTASLQVEEAALTGESQPIEKNAEAVITDTVPLGDRINMVYSGCLVTAGRGMAVVVETAMETEMGKIAKLLNTTVKMKTPLQLRLKELAKRISFTAIVAGSLMFLLGVLVFQLEMAEMLLTAIALGVAAVPETLPIIVTMILSTGVYNMVSKNTIIRKIPAIETVGNTSVICSDKTGTLTMNKMKIRRVWHFAHDPISSKAELNFDQKKLIGLLASCSNATISTHDEYHEGKNFERETLIGDPTEIAIIRMLHVIGMDRVKAEREYPRIHELPFDSGRKRMTTVHRTEEGYIAVTKGAFDRIPVDWSKNPELFKRAMEVHDSFAEKALRVIAISVKKYDHKPTDLSEEALECDQEFRGMVGMIDPPRPESSAAVARARSAGIKTVMITGDHVVTAGAIAKEIGIMEDGDRAVTGAELSEMSEEELRNQVRDISVYARVSPEDKIRIVKAWTAHDEVVAMTGDGVNDAPALKAADVGVAMGITGTEVSKSAADMVLTDDNFATIVDAISEGRTSFDNIRKTVLFLLSVNFAEILILLLGIVLSWLLLRDHPGGFGPPITAVQILVINVFSDGIPGFFIAFEPPEAGVMKRKPLSKFAGIFSQGLVRRIAKRTASFFVLTIVAYWIGATVTIGAVENGHLVARTMAFAVLSWASIVNIFTIRSQESIFKTGFMSNRGMFIAAVTAMFGTALILLVAPLSAVFDAYHGLEWQHWLIMASLAFTHLLFIELQKFISYVRNK